MSQTVSAPRTLSVGEVAQRSGVAVSALHFYESKGLIHSTRTAGNQRRYPATVLRLIAIIKVAQRAGLALTDIEASLQAMGAPEKPSTEQWQALSSEWRDTLNRRIALLSRLRDELDSCIGCGCLSINDCPLRNPGDVLGAEGPGPRWLERP